jgi:hypothetical protein
MKKIVQLENMGYFGSNRCEIDIEDKKIYCRCLDKFPECDMAQAGWGMYAYCPLYGFSFDLSKEKDKIELIKWLEWLKKIGLKEVAESIEKMLGTDTPARA